MKDYTLKELKNMILEQVNNIKGLSVSFTSAHADQAYDEATMECGFPIPAEDDEFKAQKFHWLILRMRRWFLWQLWTQYSLFFQGGDMSAQQIAFNLQKLVDKLDQQFLDAKSAPETAALFTDAELVFGKLPIIIGTGIVEDRIGESTRKELENRQGGDWWE